MFSGLHVRCLPCLQSPVSNIAFPSPSDVSDILDDIPAASLPSRQLHSVSNMASSSDPLSSDHIIELAATALRREGEQSSLKNPYEAIALIGHACMAAVGFRLVGLGEDHNLGMLPIDSTGCALADFLLQRQHHRKARLSPQNGTPTTLMPFDMRIRNHRCSFYSRLVA